MNKVMGIIATLFIFAGSASAGIYVEPYLAYATGGLEQTQSSVKYENDFTYPALGFRLGYKTMGLSIGLAGERSISGFDIEPSKPNSDNSDKTEWKSSHLGVYASYQAPLFFRVFGTYFFKNTLEIDSDKDGDNTNDNGDNWSGSGYSLGAGFTGLPFVIINLEYRAITYDEYENVSSNTTTTYPTANDSKQEEKTYLVSVSVPFDF